MDIELVDVTLHFVEPLGAQRRQQLEDVVHALDGVVSTHFSRDNPQLMVVEFNPRRTTDAAVLGVVQGQGIDAELSVPERL